jgi:hypothetical protein
MWHQSLIDLVGDIWWGLYRFHRFSKSAPYPPLPPPGFNARSRAGIMRQRSARARTFRTLLGYQLPPRAVATPRSLRASAICCSVVAPAVRCQHPPEDPGEVIGGSADAADAFATVGLIPAPGSWMPVKSRAPRLACRWRRWSPSMIRLTRSLVPARSVYRAR